MAVRIEIGPAAGTAELAAVKALFESYARGLGVDLGFQGYDQEMARFPDAYAAVLRANVDGALAGAVALKPFEGDICEMKRLYCMPDYRGLGLGRRLAEASIAEARALGYGRMRLDTLAGMSAAQALYRDLGFVEIAPYYHNPLPGTVYMERAL